MQRPTRLFAAKALMLWSLVLSAFVLIGTADAFAGRRLAVGTAAGYVVPPGYEAVPVFNRSVGYAWTPVDTSLGYAFREPIYDTPKGYRYRYVRGYSLRRVVSYRDRPMVKRVYIKKASVTKSRTVRRHRGHCVTDIGFGRHDYCN